MYIDKKDTVENIPNNNGRFIIDKIPNNIIDNNHLNRININIDPSSIFTNSTKIIIIFHYQKEMVH